MRKTSISKLRGNLKKELKNLPFAITNWGKVIAFVQKNDKSVQKNEKEDNKFVQKNDKFVQKTDKTDKFVQKSDDVQTCVHGYPKRLCKKCLSKNA